MLYLNFLKEKQRRKEELQKIEKERGEKKTKEKKILVTENFTALINYQRNYQCYILKKNFFFFSSLCELKCVNCLSSKVL